MEFGITESTAKTLIVAIAIGLCILLALFTVWPRSATSYLAERGPRRSDWESLFSSAQMPTVERILALVGNAFLLREGDTWKLRPDDKPVEIYRAIYPKGSLADALELETLVGALEDEFLLAPLLSPSLLWNAWSETA